MQDVILYKFHIGFLYTREKIGILTARVLTYGDALWYNGNVMGRTASFFCRKVRLSCDILTRFGKANKLKELFFRHSSFCVYSASHLPKFGAVFRSLRKAVLLFADTDAFDHKLLLGVRRECYFVCGNVYSRPV